jgi:hypothetical protein
MIKRPLQIVSALWGIMLMMAPPYAIGKEKRAAPPMMPQPYELKLALRELWAGHIFWVRNVVLATKYGDAEAAKVAEDQVVQNAKDIAGSIGPYYGREASDKLFGLLADHYGAIREYMNASLAGKKEGKDVAVEKLKKNADEIAVFLSAANPNWKKETLLSALVAHGGHHIAQIDAIAAKDFFSEAKTWPAMKAQVYTIADVLADGIVKQFPMKFGK